MVFYFYIVTSLLEFKLKFRKVFKAKNHSTLSLGIHLLIRTVFASDRTEVEIDFETLAHLKLFREKQLQKTWIVCGLYQTLT